MRAACPIWLFLAGLSRRDIAFLFRDGAEGYSSATSLSLDTSRGGIAKLFTPDETIMEANGDIINIKRGPIYIPYTDIKVISFSEQTTYFSDEGGGRYHAFYALSDPNKGPAVAYVADANFPAEGVSKLDDVGYCGKVGMVYQFAEFANPLKR